MTDKIAEFALDSGRPDSLYWPGNSPPVMPAIVNILLGGFFLAGLIVCGFGVRTAWRDRATTDWPQVPGQITASTVFTDSSGEGTTYKPKISYRYNVHGQAFIGQRISFGTDQISSSGRFAGMYATKYHAGREVRVAYQTDQPSVSVLEPGVTRRSFFRMAFGVGFMFFGLWFRLMMWLADS